MALFDPKLLTWLEGSVAHLVKAFNAIDRCAVFLGDRPKAFPTPDRMVLFGVLRLFGFWDRAARLDQ